MPWARFANCRHDSNHTMPGNRVATEPLEESVELIGGDGFGRSESRAAKISVHWRISPCRAPTAQKKHPVRIVSTARKKRHRRAFNHREQGAAERNRSGQTQTNRPTAKPAVAPKRRQITHERFPHEPFTQHNHVPTPRVHTGRSTTKFERKACIKKGARNLDPHTNTGKHQPHTLADRLLGRLQSSSRANGEHRVTDDNGGHSQSTGI